MTQLFRMVRALMKSRSWISTRWLKMPKVGPQMGSVRSTRKRNVSTHHRQNAADGQQKGRIPMMFCLLTSTESRHPAGGVIRPRICELMRALCFVQRLSRLLLHSPNFPVLRDPILLSPTAELSVVRRQREEQAQAQSARSVCPVSDGKPRAHSHCLARGILCILLG